MATERNGEETGIALFQGVRGEVGGLLAEYTELALDEMLVSAVPEGIPLLSSLMVPIRAAGKIRDVLFAKKVAKFLESAHVTEEKRQRFLAKHSGRKAQRRIGEAILLLLDKFDDLGKATLLGALHREAMRGEIEPERVVELGRRLIHVDLSDIRLLATGGTIWDMAEAVLWRLANASLMPPPHSDNFDPRGWADKPTPDGELISRVFVEVFGAAPDVPTPVADGRNRGVFGEG